MATSSPGRKAGRGPGRPPKHSRDKPAERVDHEGGNSSSGDFMMLKVVHAELNFNVTPPCYTHTQHTHSHLSNSTTQRHLLLCHQTTNSASFNRSVEWCLVELEGCALGMMFSLYLSVYVCVYFHHVSSVSSFCMFNRSVNCPQHTEDQRKDVRRQLLGDLDFSTPPPSKRAKEKYV